jgi:hypothetical protein
MRNLYKYTMCNRILYKHASPVASVLALCLSLLLLASASVQPAQSLGLVFTHAQCFGIVGLDWRNAQWELAES